MTIRELALEAAVAIKTFETSYNIKAEASEMAGFVETALKKVGTEYQMRSGAEDSALSELADAIYGDGGKGELATVEVLQDAVRLVKSQDAETHTKSHRERLPDTRESITHKFKINTIKGYMTVGMYEDGRPGELFIEIAKEGSTVGGLCDAIGILTSIALQRGVPIEELACKFRGTSFEPAGPTMTKEQPNATSIPDYIFTWLGRRFSEDFRAEYEAKQKAIKEFGK